MNFKISLPQPLQRRGGEIVHILIDFILFKYVVSPPLGELEGAINKMAVSI